MDPLPGSFPKSFAMVGTQTNAPLFANPVEGVIHPNDWARPAGNTDFRVTQTAVQHVAAGGPPAIDLGDGNIDADAIGAIIGGVVRIASRAGSANLETDHTDASGQKWRIVYAHNALPHPVAVGAAIVTGQVIGHVGSTGASAAHLHLQIGKVHPTGFTGPTVEVKNGLTIEWLDPWPLLAQNRPGETEMTIIPAAGFAALVNKATAIRAGTNYRSAPVLGAASLLGTTTAQVEWKPFASCSGDEANGSTTWYVGELDVPQVGHTIVFVHGSRIVSPLTPAEIVPDPVLVQKVAAKDAALRQIESEAQSGIAN
jgi:Peptidase family M23